MSRVIVFAVAALVAASPAVLRPQSPQRLALTNARIYPVSSPVIASGTILIDGDTITSVAAGGAVPAGYQRVDLGGQSVFPGLINSITNLGLSEYNSVPTTQDADERVDPVLPQLHVEHAFRLDSRNAVVVRRYGVTSALVTPGDDNVFAGQSALISLGSGRGGRDEVIRTGVAMHVNLGEPPLSAYGSRNRMPMTRMGLAALVRQTLITAKEYAAAGRTGDPRMDALGPVLTGGMPVIIRAQRMDDILMATRLSEEFGLRMILSYGVGAYKVADVLAARKIPVLLGPVTSQPQSIELQSAIYENAAMLSRAGVKFAIMTGGTTQAGQLPFHAGIAAAYGLDRDEALKAITLAPAEILGIADRYGSIDRGKAADLVVAEGLVLQPRARISKVYVGGREVSLRGWQEELADRYR